MISPQVPFLLSRRRACLRFIKPSALILTTVVYCSITTQAAHAQVAASASKGGFALSAGGTFSAYYTGYGERTLLGPTAFVDVGSHSPLTVEAEARWLDLRQTAGVHEATYLAGPRYSFRPAGRFTPYAKFLIGDGEFTFPYDLAHGSYFVLSPGAGVDFRAGKRISLRLVDLEYQHWNDFTYGGLPTYGVSSGVRIRIF